MKKSGYRFSRRGFLKTGAALVATQSIAAPFVITRAFAGGGTVNFMGWAGYPLFREKVFPAFEAATGVKVNFIEQPDQDAMYAQAKLSLATGNIDVAEPTVDRLAAWNSQGLVQGWDESKLDLSNYLPGMADGAMGKRSTIDGKRKFLPAVWGTEALVYKKGDAKLSSPASLGDLFSPDNQVTIRPHSALAAMGRWLEANGKLPRPWSDSYSDMAVMTQLWDIALAEAIKHKGNVVQWWSGENDANAGFTTNGATLGLCWDSTGFNLRNNGFVYAAPGEGAFAWNEGLVLLANAKNVDESHALAKWVSTAEGSALWGAAVSANPAAKGGPKLLNPDNAAFYEGAFDEGALKKLWWWPDQNSEFVAKRGEYADKYRAA
ncbi:extracellular solute-binding protein [Mesorhizobium amorphae]|uniref:extracellular solute-binding protein n=1 Tax=Mesorhizobium amorphae TaxID=71433 RepID=UPI0017830BD9|nr:extracellular solute-binding protein [Mesorhizobium amorphae]